MLPWSEMDSLQLETGYIKDQLVALNRKGFLTINSQPGVNGACSTDPKVGWGGPNGWVLTPHVPRHPCTDVAVMSAVCCKRSRALISLASAREL